MENRIMETSNDARQLTWQDWRNRLYECSCRESGLAAGDRRHMERRHDANPRYPAKDTASENQARIAREIEELYRQAVRHDTSIKQAREQGADEHDRALAAAEQFMAQQAHLLA